MRKPLKTGGMAVLVLVLGGVGQGTALENYNGYGGYVIGDHRIVGLAGAYLAKSNDLNAVNYNPAGLIFSPAALDAGLAKSELNNAPTDFDQNGAKDSFPLSYFFAGLVGRTHRASSCFNIALGVVYDVPYAAEQNFSGLVSPDSSISGYTNIRRPATTLEKYQLKMEITSFSIPISWQVASNLALGANINVYSVAESIRMKYPLDVYYLSNPSNIIHLDDVAIDDEQKVSGTTIDFGVLYRSSDKLSYGAVFKPNHTFNFAEKQFATAATKTDTGIKWYRNVSLPLRLGIGVNYEYAPESNIGLDTNYLGKQDNTVLVGSGLVSGIEKYEFKDKGVYDLHIGGNYLWSIRQDLQINWRAGTYYEPTRVKKLDSRWHYTGGWQINWLYFMVGFGYDKATDYRNMVTVVALLIRR
ncbi:MAG: hypothetical protein HY920_00910 [Elusimicrobia bacterium]|nr:hypothetical protein [Elusimicrobiota bacterium]